MMFEKRFERKLLVFALLVVFALISTNTVLAGKTDAKHGFLGVYLEGLDDSMREALDYEEPGVLVQDIVKGGAADNAGIKSGDIIVKFGNKTIFDVERLRKLIGLHDPGEKVEVVVFRDGKNKSFTVELEEKEKHSDMHYFSINDKDIQLYTDKIKKFKWTTEKKVYLGVNIEDLEEQLGEYFGVKDGNGSLVTKIHEDSPAEKAGLKAGDVIVAIADEPVTDNSDIGYILEDFKDGDEVVVKVIRDKKEKTLKVTLLAPPDDWMKVNVDLEEIMIDVEEGLKKSNVIIHEGKGREHKNLYFGGKAQ
jgi:serine protease Do